MAIIEQETIQKILDATDIVELIQGYFPLKRSGSNWVALCPFHNEKSESFNVNPGMQIFNCFGCGQKGDAIKFLQLYDNLPFPEAAKRLADRGGVIVKEEAYDPQQAAKAKRRNELMRMQRTAADWFNRLLFKNQIAQPARDYLKGRGYGMEVSRDWKFGFAPEDQRLFFDWAQSEGFPVPLLVEGGLAKWRDEHNPNRGAYSFFRHRLMFPICNAMGEPIAFSGRVLDKEQKGGKYVNSPETILFNKSKTLFGIDRSKRFILREKKAVVFEGQLDLISAYENGITNAVAPLGTAFTEEHARVIKRQTDEVILCYDSDTAGLNAASKAFRFLAPQGVLVRLAVLPPGEDPDSLIQKAGAQALIDIIGAAPEFFDFQIDSRGTKLNQGTLRDRLNFAKDLSADIALIDDKMLLDSLISRVTVRLGVGEDDIRKLVRDAIAARERIEKNRNRRDAIARKRAQDPGGGQNRSPQNSTPETNPVSATATEINNRSIRLLCKCLLTSPEIRAKLIANPPPDFFQNLTETELLAAIWRGQFDPASPGSVNAFINQLSDGDQQCAFSIINESSAKVSHELALDCISALKKHSVQNQIAVTKSQLGTPNLPANEVARLSKLLLDLRTQLNDR